LRQRRDARRIEVEHRAEAEDRIGGREKLRRLELHIFLEPVETARFRQDDGEDARRGHLPIGFTRIVGTRDLQKFVAHALARKLAKSLALLRAGAQARRVRLALAVPGMETEEAQDAQV